ncbi:hypothetical protein AIOL_003655 [Candidatus Rhodobacter oscarellae]|uniref:Dynamin N-terminal domain-containing protein n=1 Tax=Candidatus Rhodobacter oscarellae TaxID=1675527 RepID=A0A0J9E7K1_9RHOB|nr:dynamin family protein [Candidatus Rhodobacter lobularis]KMW58676.1 hypothetical protein AIOL_003655 [Candidatus Rhodobacter lobularis]
MGEFSAGKSTLTNMLIGRNALPTKVTATQLPPVWISHGADAPYFRSTEGEDCPFDTNEIDQISPHDTEYIRIFHKADTLELFDIIDMPGISDPNIPAEVWERVMEFADAAIWCTHATQAWRQSEAAVWEAYSEALADKSLLLVTRFDKILSDSDRRRVLQRMQTEAGDMFRAILPISLTQALDAENDFALWEKSGAAEFVSALVGLSRELSAEGTDAGGTDPSTTDVENQRVAGAEAETVTPLNRRPAPPVSEGAVMPRRVQSGPRYRERPVRPPA